MGDFAELKGYLFDSMGQLLQTVSDYLPNLLSAAILLIGGFLLASLVRWLIMRLGAGIDRLIHAVGFVSLHTRLKWPVSDILGWLIYWVIVLLFVRASLASLKLPSLAELLGKLITYLPNLITAALFIIVGTLVANTVRDKLAEGGDNIGLRQAGLLAGLVRFSIIALAVLVGMAQVGLDVRLFELVLTIFVAALAGSIGLAFGLGAGSTVSNIIAARYIRKNYQTGQRIRIQDLEGKILELLPTGIILDTRAGRTFVPAKIFDEEASVLLDDDTVDEH